MFDGVGEFAVLVRDDAEKMCGLGRVRLRLQDLAADCLGLHEPALAAAAIGISERLAERHKGGVALSRSFDHVTLTVYAARRRPGQSL